MPYPTLRYSAMNDSETAAYEDAWVRHLADVGKQFAPEIVHAHHVWLIGARLRELFPDVPIVSHCHGTGLRQMELCPHLRERVRSGCARLDCFAVLHREQRRAVVAALGVDARRVVVVGAGYREHLFHDRGRAAAVAPSVVFAGKLSRAKGLPWLLDAVDRLSAEREVHLHVAGAGTGPEAEALRARILGMGPRATLHGQLAQEALAELMRASSVFVLPSMYEGLPLVLIEAAACGCRLVCTDLQGVREELFPVLRPALEVVRLPRLAGADEPLEEDLPRFVDELTRAVGRGLDAGDVAPGTIAAGLAAFTWDAVFERVERVWLQLLDETPARRT